MAAVTKDDQPAEAEAQAAQADEIEAAEAKREKQRDKAATLKAVPEGANAPTEKGSGDDTTFQRDWLIANAHAMLGHPTHVVAGALAASTDEYLTVKDATARVEQWLQTPVGSNN